MLSRECSAPLLVTDWVSHLAHSALSFLDSTLHTSVPHSGQHLFPPCPCLVPEKHLGVLTAFILASPQMRTKSTGKSTKVSPEMRPYLPGSRLGAGASCVWARRCRK